MRPLYMSCYNKQHTIGALCGALYLSRTSLATLQGELEEAYSRREGMKIVSREIVDVPVTVLARDESSGATIYGGDFGGLSSPRQKKEMDEMMKKKADLEKRFIYQLHRLEAGSVCHSDV